jgi:hypothetical protein
MKWTREIKFMNMVYYQRLLIFIPPLTSKTVPEENCQSPLAREATALATSSGVPHLF